MDIVEKFSPEYYGNCMDMSDILSNIACLSDVDDRPAVYGLYIRSYPRLTLLYIGSTNDMWRRLIDLVGFEHTFTYRLYLRLLERELGRDVSEEEADDLWYNDRKTRLKIIQKINKLFKHICIKIEYVESEEEARKYEQLLIDTYKPLNPHYKENREELEKLLRFIECREKPCISD